MKKEDKFEESICEHGYEIEDCEICEREEAECRAYDEWKDRRRGL